MLDVGFDDARRAAKSLGGSLNDLFVTASGRGGRSPTTATSALPVDELRMAMPVSTRQGRSAGGNSFVPTRVLVPTGDLDPVTRFALVHEALTRTKRERAIGLVPGLAGVVNLLPTSVVVRIARQQAETVDFTTSNVRAAPFDLYIAGAHIEATYPLGPLAGTRVQRHDDVLPGLAQRRPAHRHRHRHRARAAARPPGRGVRRAHRRRRLTVRRS